MEDVSSRMLVASDRPGAHSSGAGRAGRRRGWGQPWPEGRLLRGAARARGCGRRHRGGVGVHAGPGFIFLAEGRAGASPVRARVESRNWGGPRCARGPGRGVAGTPWHRGESPTSWVPALALRAVTWSGCGRPVVIITRKPTLEKNSVVMF